MSRADIPFNSMELARLDIFRGVGLESLEGYLEACRHVLLETGDLLLSPEQENLEIFGILDGALDVHLNDATTPPLVTLGPGACVGEMSIVDGQKPSAFVAASQDTRLLAVSHETLWAMCNTAPTIARNLLVMMAERVRAGNQIIADSEGILREYERNAMTDALTELNNRHWMEEMFRRKMTRCTHDDQPVCLIMLDIDRFKSYNDQYGHLAGDRALCHVAEILRTHVRPNDMVARYGGDEFTVLLPETDLNAALITAERVRRGIVRSSRELEEGRSISISLGVAETAENDSLETLLNKADFALYRAKLAGRDCVAQ